MSTHVVLGEGRFLCCPMGHRQTAAEVETQLVGRRADPSGKKLGYSLIHEKTWFCELCKLWIKPYMVIREVEDVKP